MTSYYRHSTPMGELWSVAEDGCLTGLNFSKPTVGEEKQNEVHLQTARQLDDYFAGRRKTFDLPLRPAGTPFQQKVWEQLRLIPYGQTLTYGQIAAAVGNLKASRAVGLANNRNPIAVIVPCHRVIGSNGKLTGYAGGLDKKQLLLSLEQNNK